MTINLTEKEGLGNVDGHRYAYGYGNGDGGYGDGNGGNE